jgi:6-phosphofructokinase
MIKVAIITSGGDGAGINAALEILSRNKEIDLYGFSGGYDGILTNSPIHLTPSYCENRSLDGRHMILTSRSKLPYTKEGREKLHKKLKEDGYEYLIVCGGNGSQRAAHLLHAEGTKTIFIPMTVDNDVGGTDYTIGYDTALNYINEVLYGLHDTASNMPGRIFMVEVLGGIAGSLALESSIGGACDLAIIPEFCTDPARIVSLVQEKLQQKSSLIIICSEAAYEDKNYHSGNQGISFQISEAIEAKTNIRVRKSIMGFYIRSGKPSSKDALIASTMGYEASKCVLEGRSGVMMGVKNGRVQPIELRVAIDSPKRLESRLVELAKNHKIIIES